MYRSQSTVSKYIYISKNGVEYKIRFSNHKASPDRELSNDCDFYVGIGNRGIIRTEQLIVHLLTGEGLSIEPID